MKILDFAIAPNPTKLRIYLHEKGLTLPIEPVDVLNGQNRTPEFLGNVNPLGGLPVLQLDDGSYLTESLAIIQYLEELNPSPNMIGATPLERARVREVERICELGVMNNVGTVFQNTSPFFAGRVKQSPDAAETGRNRIGIALRALDRRIGRAPFVAGDRPSIADCTLMASIRFAEFGAIPLPLDECPNVTRWCESFKQRPSAQA
jgi:glutathione S-transferase